MQSLRARLLQGLAGLPTPAPTPQVAGLSLSLAPQMKAFALLAAMAATSANASFFDLEAYDIAGNLQQFSQYRGQVVLVVNVATV